MATSRYCDHSPSSISASLRLAAANGDDARTGRRESAAEEFPRRVVRRQDVD
jgi:hypothetical protein